MYIVATDDRGEQVVIQLKAIIAVTSKGTGSNIHLETGLLVQITQSSAWVITEMRKYWAITGTIKGS